MRIFSYDRAAALSYAQKWSFGRNPAYYNFERVGGDCTNFASQCVYAGTKTMNFTPVYGWYYRSVNDRAPAWTGVEYLYRFLTTNEGAGPFAEEAQPDRLEPGDLIQLGRETGDFYHTPVIISIRQGHIFVAAHTFDAYERPLSSYFFERARGIHILGVRKEE